MTSVTTNREWERAGCVVESGGLRSGRKWSGGGRGLGGEIDALDLRAWPMNPETALGILLGRKGDVNGAWPEWAELKHARPLVVLKIETRRPKRSRESSVSRVAL